MAMLAESRKRYKWMYNPRGQDWVNDDNKYGKKLMEKMGWSKGKGLGRTEQGNVDHIEVNIKNDSKGIGFKVTDDAWIKHYEGFENVLATLNSENNSAAASPIGSAPNSAFNSDDEETKVSSLEALSKSSQARVHYHKFTRGKDLSLLNPDDIACITGSKRAKKLAKLAKDEDFHEDEVGHTQHNGGLTTIKGGNIQDYFAKKWATIKGKTSQQEDAVENCDSSDLLAETGEAVDEPDTCLKKNEKKKRKKEVNIDDEIHMDTDVYLQKCKKDGTEKKSRKVRDRDKKKELESEVLKEQDDYSESLEEQLQKKKKKRMSKCEENVNEESCTISTDLEETLPKKKKKNKRSLKEKEMEVEPSVETAFLVDESRFILETKHDVEKLKKKKNKRKTDCIDESECKNDDNISVFLDEPPKKKKKKLISEEKAMESYECASDLNEINPVSDIKKDEGYLENNELAHKKKKKKSKSDVEENNKSNNKMNNFDESSVGDSGHKKKKKSKHREI